MKIREHITWLIEAANRADLEDQKLDEKYGIDSSKRFNPFDEQEIKRAFEINIEEDQIEEYLKALNYSTLLQLEGVMCFGRDGGDIEDKIKYFADLEETKEEIIRNLIEKRALYPIYFKRAFSKAKDSGFEIK